MSLWLGVQTGTITVPPGNSGFLLIKDYCNCSPRLWHRIYSDCFPIALRKYSQQLMSLWLGVQTGTITVPPGNSGFLLIKDYCNCCPRVWHRIYSDCSLIALRKYSQHLVSLWLGVQTGTITVPPGNSGFLLIMDYYNCCPRLWHRTHSDCSPIALRKLKSTLSVAMAWGIDWYYNCSPGELWSLTNKGILQLFPEDMAQNI